MWPLVSALCLANTNSFAKHSILKSSFDLRRPPMVRSVIGDGILIARTFLSFTPRVSPFPPPFPPNFLYIANWTTVQLVAVGDVYNILSFFLLKMITYKIQKKTCNRTEVRNTTVNKMNINNITAHNLCTISVQSTYDLHFISQKSYLCAIQNNVRKKCVNRTNISL